jgi:hypothetical protein
MNIDLISPVTGANGSKRHLGLLKAVCKLIHGENSGDFIIAAYSGFRQIAPGSDCIYMWKIPYFTCRLAGVVCPRK